MLVENLEQIEKLKNGRKKQLVNWQTKKSEKSVEKKAEEIQLNSKTSTKEERTRSSKVEVKEVTKAKVMTRHSDINGLASSNKLKTNLKRKMST